MKSIIAALFVSAIAASSAAAQSTAITASVPFAFEVCGQKLPAGEYRVTQMVSHIQIATAKGIAKCVSLTSTGAPSSSPSLVFHRYDDRYFFVTVNLATTSRVMAESQAEREIRRSSVSFARPAVVVVRAD